LTNRHSRTIKIGDGCCNPFGQRYTATPNTDENYITQAAVALVNFMSYPH
jgi:hypothetical protein